MMKIEGRPRDFCLPECPHMDLEIDEIYAEEISYHFAMCTNERVCEMWYKKQQNSQEKQLL